MSNRDELFMNRCFDLALHGGKNVRPNPLVGAVLVNENKIIGEGFHKQFGGPHAEVEALNSVTQENRPLIKDSTLYISLEPCNYHGKTPACSNLILENGIKKLVVSALDPNPQVSGSSLDFLEDRGVIIKRNVLNDQGEELIKVFSKNIKTSKPYVILKYAESKDHFIGKEGEKIKLSNQYSDIFVHKLRDFSDGIMVGTNTVLTDNPSLTTRLINGDNPVRIVLDRNLKTPSSFNVFNDETRTIIINEQKDEVRNNLNFKKMDFESQGFISDLLLSLYEEKIYVLLVEGGAKLISSFIQCGEWDEAVIITTPLILYKGIKAPEIEGKLYKKMDLGDDCLRFVRPV
ncbi:MAG: bifunctional diaminohydroxyphosphoribosylaminopyrimidine deaminase/5-amino-6-(5-phosphoribosylamino)uracil reductase RibD [Saprospiraceae bacterium]|nr:bifunctional diaminohydroxyphosphoribosylaminopyrimidine deaminase/5-amino-6-(5-phosphoribosylamino)uracil reductase RibD [Saprospiraceae bacterium]